MATKPTASLIAGKTFKEIIWSPFVYAPYALVAIGNAIMPIAPWMNLSTVLAVTAGHIWYWRRNWNAIYQKHEFAEVVNYRRDQNQELKQRFGDQANENISPNQLASMLAALQTKVEIEQKIFDDGNITLREQELLETIDQTVNQMVQVIVDSNAVDEPPPEFQDALSILTQINKNFQHVTRPVFPTAEETKTHVRSELAESTKALKNRMDEANRIRSIALETREKTQ